MAFQVETPTNIDPLAAALQTAVDLQSVSEDGLRELRHLLHRSSPLNNSQINKIFDAHQKMPAEDRQWIDFFLEALTDSLLTRRGDQIHLTDSKEEHLIDAIGDVEPITDLGHRHLLLRILLRADQVPERFRRLVLNMVNHHLMHDDLRLLIDLPRQPGTIDIVDLQLIRKLVFGAGGQYDRPIDRATANFLLELDQPSFVMIDQEAWRRLFLNAMSLHLLSARSHPNHVNEEHADDAFNWLVEQVRDGQSSQNTVALIQHLADHGKCLPASLRALITDSE